MTIKHPPLASPTPSFFFSLQQQENGRARAERAEQRWKRELAEQVEVNAKLEAETNGLGDAVERIRKEFAKLQQPGSAVLPHDVE